MNCGLANLFTLKTGVLPTTLVADTQFDGVLAEIGRGVAAQFDRHCNRRLAYLAGDTFEASADRSYMALPRYPVVSVSAIEMRDSATGAWTALGSVDSILFSLTAESGLAQFGAVLGSYVQRLRVTFTGGYFFETVEPEGESGYPTATPSGATALPADLLSAWLEQCQHVFQTRDRLGQTGLASGKEMRYSHIAPVGLLPGVIEMIAAHRRFT